MSLWKLYRVFAEMGAVCFGGGYAMLSLVQRVVVEEHGWATEEELMDYYAIGQCTPGVIAVNVSTFIGHKLRGSPAPLPPPWASSPPAYFSSPSSPPFWRASPAMSTLPMLWRASGSAFAC